MDGKLQRAVERGARRGLVASWRRPSRPPGELVGDWRIRFRLGQFGTDYLAHAAAACAGLEARHAADELQALSCTAADDRPLTRRRRYFLRFPPGGLPPFTALDAHDV